MGSGTWTTTGTGLNWNNGATWVNWPNSLSDIARFTGPAANPSEAITVASGIQAGGITFAVTLANYFTVVLSGGDITLADGATIIPGTSTTSGFPEIGSVIHGGAINIGDGGAAVGRMILSGNNDYTGVTTIKSNSTVNIWNANALGATGAGTVVQNGGCLMLGNYGAAFTAAEPLTLNGTGVNNGGALTTFSKGGTYAGPITLGSAARINSVSGNGYLTLSGGITGANVDLLLGGTAAISIDSTIDTGSGKVTFDGGSVTYGHSLNTANLFTGGVVLNGGYRVTVTHPTALGPADKATVTFGPGSTKELWLQKNPGMNVTIVGLNTDPTNPGSPIVRQTTSGSYGGSTLTVNNATANTFAGTLMDGYYKFTLIKGAAGTLTLSGNNTYTGTTTINGGMLLAGHANALGTAGTITVNNNGTLGVASGVTFSRTVAFNAGSGLGGSGTFNRPAAWTLPATFSLKPGLSTNVIGTLTVDTANNALTAASGTRLEIDFKADGSADKLVVAGTGSLNLGAAGDTLVLKGAIKVGSYVVASASSVSGQFDAVDKTGLNTTAVNVSYPGDGKVVVTAAPKGTTVMIR